MLPGDNEWQYYNPDYKKNCHTSRKSRSVEHGRKGHCEYPTTFVDLIREFEEKDPGDHGNWEQTKYPRAKLHGLGEKLPGLKSW